MEPEPYCDHGPFDACRCLLNEPFSNPDVSELSVNPGVTALDIAAARHVSFVPAPDRDGLEWADEHSEEL